MADTEPTLFFRDRSDMKACYFALAARIARGLQYEFLKLPESIRAALGQPCGPATLLHGFALCLALRDLAEVRRASDWFLRELTGWLRPETLWGQLAPLRDLAVFVAACDRAEDDRELVEAARLFGKVARSAELSAVLHSESANRCCSAISVLLFTADRPHFAMSFRPYHD